MSNVVTLLSIKFPLIIISKNLWKSTDPNLVTFNQNNREKNRKKIKSNITTEIEYKTYLQKEKAQLKYQQIDKSNKKKKKR